MEWRNIGRRKGEILPSVLRSKDIILFDTETSGLGRSSKIIQFSAIRYRVNADMSLTEKETMDVYLNPQEPLEEKITEITGITDEMLASARTEDELAPEIFDFLERSSLWAAYNKNFDIRMLKQMSERTGYMFVEMEVIDVLEMARDIIPKSEIEDHKLSTVAGYLFPDDIVHYHSSIEDVRAMAKIFRYFLKQYLGYDGSEREHKTPVHLEWASYTVNPNQPSQQRIKCCLNGDKYGDVFYDVVKKTWSCKQTSAAKKLFASIDLQSLEEQLLRRYGWKYGYDMNTLASNWAKEKRKKDKEKVS